jgi:putative protein kinase ArgK-like GTPase of G3E family
VSELVEAIGTHLTDLESSGGLRDARRRATRRQVLALARAIVVRRVGAASNDPVLDRLVDEVVSRKLDPHSAASQLAGQVLD